VEIAPKKMGNPKDLFVAVYLKRGCPRWLIEEKWCERVKRQKSILGKPPRKTAPTKPKLPIRPPVPKP
jgi:hypothetical protein